MKYSHGQHEILILHDVFEIPTDILEHRLQLFMLWGKPYYGIDLAIYYSWQAILRLKAGGEPVGTNNLRMVFIANLLDIRVEKLVTEQYKFLLVPISLTVERYLHSLVASDPEPEIVPARFQPMDWAWHTEQDCPVLILGWDKDYCKFLMPMQAQNKPYSFSYWVGDGPFDAPAQGGQIYCLFVELDHEPEYLVPIRLDKEELAY